MPIDGCGCQHLLLCENFEMRRAFWFDSRQPIIDSSLNRLVCAEHIRRRYFDDRSFCQGSQTDFV
jgi:hypothetical protein